GRVDGVAQVVADPIDDVIEVVGITSHQLEQCLQHRHVVAFAVGADQIGPADLAAGQNPPDRVVVVLDVYPIPDVGSFAVQLRPTPRQHVGDLARNELLQVLIRPIVVGAVRDRRADVVGAYPGSYQHVGAGFGRRV